IHIIYGSFITLIYIFIGVIISTFAPFITEIIIEEEGREGAMIFEMVANVIRMIIFLAFLFCALPSILGGIGLLQNKSWGLVIALIAGCISLLSFPFGTALGVYTLYVFVQSNKQKNDQNQE
ncbi:MAG: hypothetical protein AAF391_09955, partial [Bacteroidota bacterium]